jgi:hypothetical protein
MTMKSPSTRLADAATHAAIVALCNEHAYRLDHGQADTLWELYAEDGALLNLPPKDLIGQGALRTWGAERVKLPRISRHVETNHRVWWDGEVLRGVLYASVYRSEAPEAVDTTPLMVGDYEDEYTRSGDGWLIRKRYIRKAFRAAR